MEIPEKGPMLPLPAGDPAGDPRRERPTEPIERHGPAGKDTVSLTARGREFKAAVEQAQTLPDIRLDRVEQLKRQLAAGTYRIEGDRIAVGMIDETLENNTVLKHIDTTV